MSCAGGPAGLSGSCCRRELRTGLVRRPARDAQGLHSERLWTPLAGSRVEWFVWPDAVGGLALMALFTPDEARPWDRFSVETSVSGDDLASFGRSLESEYEALVQDAG